MPAVIVCVLEKSLYGLRQSGLQWHIQLVDKLKVVGLIPLLQDPCMFITQKGDKLMYVAIYLDNILIATDDDD